MVLNSESKSDVLLWWLWESLALKLWCIWARRSELLCLLVVLSLASAILPILGLSMIESKFETGETTVVGSALFSAEEVLPLALGLFGEFGESE